MQIAKKMIEKVLYFAHGRIYIFFALTYERCGSQIAFCNSSDNFVAALKQKSSDTQSGTLEKMIVASGSVATDVDLNRLNGIRSRRQS